MRAKNVYNSAWIWDFDDTLFTTDAQVHVHDNDSGEYIKSLKSNQFNTFKKLPSQFLDFQDFVDNRIIVKGETYKAFPILKNIDQQITEGSLFGDLYILTARTPHVQKGIFDVLKAHGIENIKGNNIICMGDGRGEIDIANEKKKYLAIIKKKYDQVYFYDDDKKNIKSANDLGINSYLIEEYI